MYRLQAMAVRHGWAAVNESIATFPPITLDDITGSRLLVELGDARHAEAARGVVLDAATLAARTPCETLNAPGRYVRTVPTTTMFEPTAPPVHHRLYPAGPGLGYYTDLITELVWVPFTCRAPRIDRTACFRGRRVNVRGDSQARTLFNYIALSVCSITDTAEKGLAAYDNKCHDAAPGRCAGTHLCYTNDGGGGGAVDVSEWDLIVANFGQHYSASPRVPVSRYERDHVPYCFNASLLAGITERQQAHPEFRYVWVDTQPLSIRNDGFVHAFGDWRTHPRATLYNRAVARVLEPHRRPRAAPARRGTPGSLTASPPLIDIVEVEDVLRLHIDAAADNAHPARVWPALDAMVERVLAAFCSTADDLPGTPTELTAPV